MMNCVFRRAGLTGSLLLLAAPVQLSAQPAVQDPLSAEAAAAEQADDVGLGRDARFRMTVPISIDGKGPFEFLIDTGAERTIIGAELARSLALPAGKSAMMHSMSGAGTVRTVIIPRLQVSKKSVSGIHAPALKEIHIGASGMLGIDSLQSQRITFDFQRQKMTVVPSRTPQRESYPDEIVVTARSRLGRLVLVDARIDGEKLMVVLDTGAEVSIGNEALRRKLTAKRKIGPTMPIELISVTGGKIMADYTQAKQVRLGGILINNLPVAFTEAHPFKQLGLSNRPALLLGMDALRLFDRVSVDFANRKVRFLPPDRRSEASRERYAARREGFVLR